MPSLHKSQRHSIRSPDGASLFATHSTPEGIRRRNWRLAHDEAPYHARILQLWRSCCFDRKDVNCYSRVPILWSPNSQRAPSIESGEPHRTKSSLKEPCRVNANVMNSREERANLVNQRISSTITELSDGAAPTMRGNCTRAWPSNTTMVIELARLLLANPAGLRRWSVMRAMRKVWQKAEREISQKFEDEVERSFRHFNDDDRIKLQMVEPEDALFFRPRDKAGEVWAAYPDRAHKWLAAHAAKTD
jgi:hypothetical protein